MTTKTERFAASENNRLSRRGALIALSCAGAAMAFAASPSNPIIYDAAAAGSGGLGVTRDDWESMIGPGEAGQGATFYTIDNVRFAVLFDFQGTNRLTSISWTADSASAEISLDNAKAAAATFLPEDASLREEYDVPGAGIGPISLVQLYKSATLKNSYGDTYTTSGNFVIWYRFAGTLDLTVAAFDVFVGTRPLS